MQHIKRFFERLELAVCFILTTPLVLIATALNLLANFIIVITDGIFWLSPYAASVIERNIEEVKKNGE